MKAVCPKNKNHKEFITTAHVVQEWKVDAEGDWLKTVDNCVQVTHKPNRDDVWTCAVCGAEAEVE
ncbi:hypothetical protein [Bacillus cereus group sp. TH152-1LC]|uniref:hypothetical protein n=1 Tax=Bacillus cereus group sp. TH152-1LC TaxID=3018060 RepID=UPI0022E5432E|nr:hypothetical protein [Bacillus cereus group sp. TH152-1LC]MDA1674754.1 hypothetical protein [Bacillus cereus group sp. TH152-1LC]